MKKIAFILLAISISLGVQSCKKDDDSGSTRSSSLVGTVWVGQETTDGTYTFASTTEFTFVDIGEAPVNGTYTFDGNDGVLTEETGFVAPFSISGGIMSVEANGSTRVYIKQ